MLILMPNWSFIGGSSETNIWCKCPCGTLSSVSSSSFVGNDYFYESGVSPTKLYPNDPLWDGQKCSSIEKPCCWVPGLPCFHKTLGYTTTDYIEMRLCCDEGSSKEDVPFSIVEVYIILITKLECEMIICDYTCICRMFVLMQLLYMIGKPLLPPHNSFDS